MEIVKKIVGLIAALLLMAVVGTVAFFLAKSSPSFHPGWFYGVGLCLYTMAVLSYLHLDPFGPPKRQRRE